VKLVTFLIKIAGLMIGISACMFTLSTLVSILIYGAIILQESNLPILLTEITLAIVGIVINTFVLLQMIMRERDEDGQD